ncbi:hypothetical protein CANARDRAFT_9076 [[Candida] arabinofermentans NRRL YB-2248]|uniref:amidase n=1 Tax=[Candida] arabinofermentans NRRL YB-2248 TaxID=983967 RepID=A0A1E4SX70_9ASCO|nr:hypothetical protein CANARDRAFT_9076 [[Candida] arabinofermentans NRRL YB-2248]
MSYLETITAKQQSLLSKIPREWLLESIPTPESEPNVNDYLLSIFPADEQSIIEKSATELLQLQAAGKLTATEIVRAYCHRSALSHQLTSCLVEIFYDEAFKTAKKLDEYFEKTGQLIGPLHGIPISLKDQVNLPNITTSLGYLAPFQSSKYESIICNKTKDTESYVAQILSQAGCVFYVKTTVPMAMLSNETHSNISQTLNANDRTKSSGGSSGGEGALLASYGSIIGLGTDIGGSIRIPSVMAGIFGLRSSSNRLPYLNVSNSYENQTIVCSVIGPMCRYVTDLQLVFRILINAQPWIGDPKVVPIEYRKSMEVSSLEGLNVGVLRWDGELMPHPPILRAIDELADNMKAKGVDVVSISQPPIKHSLLGQLLLNLYGADNLDEVKRFAKMSGEPLPSSFKIASEIQDRHATLEEYFAFAGLKHKYQQIYDEFWNGTNELTKNGKMLDCYILPGYSCTGWTNGDNVVIGNVYTRHLNVLDYSVITIPVSKVKETDVSFEREFVDEKDKACWEYYDVKKYVGLPVTLQLVCRRYQEEKCISIAKLLMQEIIGKSGIV